MKTRIVRKSAIALFNGLLISFLYTNVKYKIIIIIVVAIMEKVRMGFTYFYIVVYSKIVI